MASQWFYTQNGQRFGPYSSADLKALAASGEVHRETLVWKEGLADWVPAQQVEGMFDLTATAKTPSPPPVPSAVGAAPAPDGSLPPVIAPRGGEMYGGTLGGQGDAAFLPQPSNGMATASLVLGLFLCVPLCSLLAIIFGAIGISRANKPSARGAGKNAATCGLVLGIIGLLLIPILLVLSSAVAVLFNGTTEKANVSAAKVQISLFRTALGLYESDNGHFPLGSEGGLQALVTNPGGLPNWKTGGYLDRPMVPKDPWGHDYVYQNPGSNVTAPPTALFI